MLPFYALILVIIGFTIAGIKDFLNGKYSKEGIREKLRIGPAVIVTGTFLFAALFLAIMWIFQYSQGNIPPQKPDFWISVSVTSVLNVIMNLLIFTAYTKADITLVQPLWALPPLFMVFSAWIMMGEIPGVMSFFGIVLIVFGVYHLNSKKAEKQNNGRVRNFFRPFAGIWKNAGTRLYFFAMIPPVISIVYDKKAVLASDPLTETMVSSLIIGTLTLTYVLLTQRKKTHLNLKWLKRLSLLGFFVAIIILLYNTALSMAFVSYVGSIKRLSIIVTMSMAFIFLKEKKEFKRRLASAAIMIVGVVIIALSG